jgi:sulfhydrogenase subunit beta (sulfur reductase)
VPGKPKIDTAPPDRVGARALIERADFPRLLDALHKRGYRVIGPTLRDQAIVYDELESEADLPIGWTDEQGPGRYRLAKRSDEALFGYAVGPHSWKQFLHPPLVRLWQGVKEEGGFRITHEPQDAPRYAFLGVRSCELHAIAIQDRVFLGGPYTDTVYGQRRDNICVVAMNCGQPGGTCFCASMGTGPRADAGFDLSLTEVLEWGRHYFVAEVGTTLGAEILADVPHDEARDEEVLAAERVVADATSHMGRTLDTTDIHDLLMTNLEHPRWEDVANRCLSCGNCTMVCPTCFCTSVEDVTDLAGEHAERVRRWDSCFTADFSYISGGSIRNSTKSRYRQWMTHKLATWIDQFGTSGCVGCGRCITWCPVGIDITEEVRAIRDSERSTPEPAKEA